MRPTAWVNSLAVFLALAAVANDVSKAQAKQVRIGRHSPPAVEQVPVDWVVVGDFRETDDEAIKSALEKARDKVTEYLRSQSPPIEWSPDPAWIQEKLVRDLIADQTKDLEFKDSHAVKVANHTALVETTPFDVAGKRMFRAAVRVEVNQLARSEIEDQERQYQHKERIERATARQGVMVRVLGGLVALLVVIACYLRLEDATKGYYTTLLRLAAVAFVLLVGAGIWLLT